MRLHLAHLHAGSPRHPGRGHRLVVAVLALTIGSAVTTAACTSSPPENGTATVTRDIDGDTIEVRLGTATETIRLLGVDTPETHHPTKPVGCYGPEAAAHTAELLPVGTEVTLERDEEARDRYGRLLAYVHRADDDLFVNLELVADGWGTTLIIAPNEAYATDFRTAEATARAEQRGLWGACGPPS